MEILEVLIGLIFIYLVLSLVCTAVNEFIAQVINLRGTTLRGGLRTLIEGPEMKGLGTRVINRFRKGAAPASTPPSRDAAWSALQTAAAIESQAVKDKEEQLSQAHILAENWRARAMRAATLAERSGTEEAAKEATKAAAERNRAQDEVSKLTKEVADARKKLFAKAPTEAAAWEAAENHARKASSPVNELYDHSLIAALRSKSLLWGNRLPSYIPADLFATALLDVVVPAQAGTPKTLYALREGAQKLPPQIGKALTVLIDQAGDSVQDLQLSVSRWFNDAMERVSGAYKRRTQLIILVIALIVTVGANADTIHIWRTLSRDDTVRAAVLSAAEAYRREGSATMDTVAKGDTTGLSRAVARVDSAIGRIDEVTAFGVPLGWRDSTSKKAWSAIPGWIITALAISLGAPFWFDMLNKVINIRAAGRAPEEKPKPPEALPPPRGA